ncbi:MAG: hypothetical protein KDK66_00230 [Deltaproteobacteria bacterium]|nr:hypothetical protein [Deltaproteobacteria bacterium]
MRLPVFFAVILLSLWVIWGSSCGFKAPLSLQNPQIFKNRSDSFYQNQRQLKSLKSYAQISLAYPHGIEHWQGVLWIEAPNHLRFLFLDDLGQSQANLIISDQWIWIQNFHTGKDQLIKTQEGQLQKAFKIKTSVQELIQAILLHKAPPEHLSYGKLQNLEGFWIAQESLFTFKKGQMRLSLEQSQINPEIDPTNFWIPGLKSE